MANVQSKIINGVEFKASTNDTIFKLSDLPQSVPHTIVSKNYVPTGFASYIITVSNDDTSEECKVYMPEYIAKYAFPDKRFVYNGLHKKGDGSGHSYHNVLWA